MTTIEMPQDVDTVSNFLSKVGQYHCSIVSIEENPTNKDGELIEWAEVRLNVQVLAGTESSEAKKTGSFLFGAPNMSHRDGGAYAQRLLARLARAADVLPTASPGEQVTIDWSQAAAKQIVIFLHHRKDNNGKEHIDIDGLNIYRVTDDEVKHVPKDPNAIKLVQPARSQAPQATSPQPSASSAPQTPASPAPTGSPVSFDDL